MNTTMSLEERISAFAAAVRAELGDLPAEDADDITVGLAADLAERAADNDGVIDLDDPAGYAEELRTAAGLPLRGATPRQVPFSERVRSIGRSTAASIRRSAFGQWLLDLLIALRPVWWVLRGATIYGIGLVLSQRTWNGFWPETLLGWLTLTAITLVSIQWGRSRWLPRNALRHIRTVVSAIALAALPFVFAWMVTPPVHYYAEDYYAPTGLQLDGVQVGNIFAYDSEGNPLTDVQLFTGLGTPLNLHGADSQDVFDWADDGAYITVPLRDFRDQPIWNVYPLQQADLDDETGEIDESSIRPATPPFERATPVTSERAGPSPSPEPSASPEPEGTPGP